MARRLLMLDSGAFSVWNKGHSIDLNDYRRFCNQYPQTSYFVNLDVIPGTPGKKNLDRESVEASCEAGWQNYQRLLKRLPLEKVIPVFHQNDSFKWLEKYIDFGSPYIGISPANDTAAINRSHQGYGFRSEFDALASRRHWLNKVATFILDSGGKPIVKTHGFAVTSFALIKEVPWQWTSVDSASWKLQGAWGGIYVPHRNDYSLPPESFAVSPQSPRLGKRNVHFENVRAPVRREKLDEWLKSVEVPFGRYITADVDKTYKLNVKEGETWFDKLRRVAMRIVQKGVCNSFEMRAIVNMIFMQRAAKALRPYVKHIYFAGSPLPYPCEYDLNKRLLSFHEIRRGGKMLECFEKHLELLET